MTSPLEVRCSHKPKFHERMSHIVLAIPSHITYTITLVIKKDNCCRRACLQDPLWQAKAGGSDGPLTDRRSDPNTATKPSTLYPLAVGALFLAFGNAWLWWSRVSWPVDSLP